jgi:hypothetical protein
MAAVNMSLVSRSEYAVHQLMKRKNWAQREPGVIIVLVIVFLVAILVLAMFINKRVRAPSLPPFTNNNKPLTPHAETSCSRPCRIRYPTERVESCRCVGGTHGRAAEVGASCDDKREEGCTVKWEEPRKSCV